MNPVHVDPQQLRLDRTMKRVRGAQAFAHGNWKRHDCRETTDSKRLPAELKSHQLDEPYERQDAVKTS